MDARSLWQVSNYKRYAEQCRKIAARTSKTDDKELLEEMAIAWELVARERERRLSIKTDKLKRDLSATSPRDNSAGN